MSQGKQENRRSQVNQENLGNPANPANPKRPESPKNPECCLEDFLEGVHTIAIAGHVNPDGDCIGSCLGAWLYLRDNYPQIQAQVYLQPVREVFGFIEGLDQVRSQYREEQDYDLLILLDISSQDRIGVAGACIKHARKTLCIDHHITNRGTYTWLFNDPKASSASEVLFRFLDPEKISKACAEALYTGFVHDTGVFQYPATSPDTLRAAAVLMEKGIAFSRIIDESFFQKTYGQNRMLGKVLMESKLVLEGKCVIGVANQQAMEEYGVEARDMDGIVAQLRNTAGVEVAIFLYETKEDTYKVSLRSKNYVDVSKIALAYGGGGHMRAAGCTMLGKAEEILRHLIKKVEEQGLGDRG